MYEMVHAVINSSTFWGLFVGSVFTIIVLASER